MNWVSIKININKKHKSDHAISLLAMLYRLIMAFTIKIHSPLYDPYTLLFPWSHSGSLNIGHFLLFPLLSQLKLLLVIWPFTSCSTPPSMLWKSDLSSRCMSQLKCHLLTEAFPIHPLFPASPSLPCCGLHTTDHKIPVPCLQSVILMTRGGKV